VHNTLDQQTTTRIANGATSANVVVGTVQTTGTIVMGAASGRTGNIQFGSSSADYLFNMRSGTANLETKDAAGTFDIIAAGTLDLTASGGDVSVTATGANDDVIVEATGSGGTTFLGATNADQTTRLHNAGTTSNCVIGSGQTSGTLAIGINAARTGTIDVGNPTGTHLTRIRGGSFLVDVSGSCDIQDVDMNVTSKTSWTPTIGSATTDFTMTTNTGEYTKWGNMITYTFTIVWTSKNSATGNIRIKGLPFSGALDNVLGSFTDKSWYNLGPSGINIVCLSQDGQTYLDLRADGVLMTDANIDASGSFSGSITVPLA
jgi:hypothetical protein